MIAKNFEFQNFILKFNGLSIFKESTEIKDY